MAGPGHITTYALQNDTSGPRDVLARAASAGRMDAGGLLDEIRCSAGKPLTPGGQHAVDALSPRPLLALAKLLANQSDCDQDDYDAIVTYKAVIRRHGVKALRWEDRLIFLELLAGRGWVTDLTKYVRLLKLAAHDANQPHLLMANATNPFKVGDEDASDPRVRAWLQFVNDVFARDGLEPISIAPGSESAMDRILCAPATFVDGPLVTVIVPTYDPGPRIETAIEALLSQSYRNLQILIMDDATPGDRAAALDAWSARDPRITVIRLTENGGTYRARNIAVSRYAEGEYVTVHDDDDWSHPRKIEMQVQHLEASPEELANVSMLSRATEKLHFARINNNAIFTQKNYSSLMLRRSVFERLGYWDVVNRSADAEMFDRIVAVTGRPIRAAGSAPLSFLRIRESSLTSGEIHKGYIDGRRVWYQRLSRAWHAAELERGSTPFVGVDEPAKRRFAAPVGMIGSKQRNTEHSFDIVYATDFRFPGGNSSLAIRELETLLETGYEVAILQMDSPLLGPKNVIHPALLQLLDRFDPPIVSLLDDVRAQLTLVRHPTVLQYAQRSRSRHGTGQLAVIVNHAPHETDMTGSVYSVDDVVDNAHHIFGADPVLAPESGLIRGLLAELVHPARLTPFNWEGIVHDIEGRLRQADAGRSPVIGRHSRDAEHKWPSAEVMHAVYPLDGSVDVRVLGGAVAARDKVGPAVESWTVYPFGSMSPSVFLQEVDFWVYFHSDALHESFGMATAEALAAGVVTILPPYMEQSFGEGALYCTPDRVQSLIRDLWGDPDRYAEQSRRAMTLAKSRFGRSALLGRIQHFIDLPTHPSSASPQDTTISG